MMNQDRRVSMESSKGTGISTEMIAERAYERFAGRGYQHGHDLEDWLAAEAELRAESTKAGRSPEADEESSSIRRPARTPTRGSTRANKTVRR